MRALGPPQAPMLGSISLLGLLVALLLVAGATGARPSGASGFGVSELRAAADARQSNNGAATNTGAGDAADDSRIAARLAALRSRPDLYTDDALDDMVPRLPGWGVIDDFNLFAGYITVDEDAGRALFYILAQAVGDPSPTATTAASTASATPGSAGTSGASDVGGLPNFKPLVLWLNGGPGCSSIGGGFMTELGPFFPLPDGESLQRNPYAWNSFASILFVESPAFVGFSYSNTTSDAIVGDDRTAADSREFLLRFFERFPIFRTSPFYIAGESYAGHYVPTLALAIVEGNKAATSAETRINLQGFMAGNPWTDAAIDNLGAVDYWWSHALVSDQTAQGIRANCNFSRIGPLDHHPMHEDAETRDELCDEFCNKAFDELGAINIYEIYADLCAEPPALRRQVEALSWALGETNDQEGTGSATRGSLVASLAAARAGLQKDNKGQEQPQQRRRLQHQQQQQPTSYKASRAVAASGDGADPGYDPCVDDETEDYLNRPEVQRALHANQTVKLPWRWTDCTRSIMYSREDLLSSMLPVYDRLLEANLRILVYSGDVDGIVPVVGTRRWVASLRLKERSMWRPWNTGGQVGGYVVEYDGLTFATVRGAGHMVPYVQPARAWHLAKSFLEDNSL